MLICLGLLIVFACSCFLFISCVRARARVCMGVCVRMRVCVSVCFSSRLDRYKKNLKQ